MFRNRMGATGVLQGAKLDKAGALQSPRDRRTRGNLMRFRTSMSVAVCVLAAGLGVAGCSTGSSGSAAGGPATTGSGPATQAGTGTSAPASSQPAQAAADVGRCQAANLSFTLGGNRQLVPGQRAQVVDMTNKGPSACTMEGFPGVDLIGDTQGQANYDWTLVHSSATGAKVTLQPGATAHFDLVYLPAAPAGGSGNISVQRMVITTPGDPNVNSDADIQGSLAWSQAVVLQDGATHPGTYVMPVAAGS